MAAPAAASTPSAAGGPAAGGGVDSRLAGAWRTRGRSRAGTQDSCRSHRRAAGAGGRTQGAGGLGPLRGDQSAGPPARVVLAQWTAVPHARPGGQATPWDQGPGPTCLPVRPDSGAGAGSLTTTSDPPRAGAGDPARRG